MDRMILSFIFAHMNIFMFGIWAVFFGVVLVRFIRPLWLNNISYWWLIAGGIALHIFYAIFIAWGQYHIWAVSSDFTRVLLALPLPREAPLPALFEWMRPYFNHSLGYFAYYVFGRFFLNIIILFAVTGIFYCIFRLWYHRRGDVRSNDPEVLCALLLMVGWPGIFAFIPLGFVVAIFFSVGMLIFIKKNRISLIPAFFVAAPIALIGSKTILTLLHIYFLLKI